MANPIMPFQPRPYHELSTKFKDLVKQIEESDAPAEQLSDNLRIQFNQELFQNEIDRHKLWVQIERFDGVNLQTKEFCEKVANIETALFEPEKRPKEEPMPV